MSTMIPFAASCHGRIRLSIGQLIPYGRKQFGFMLLKKTGRKSGYPWLLPSPLLLTYCTCSISEIWRFTVIGLKLNVFPSFSPINSKVHFSMHCISRFCQDQYPHENTRSPQRRTAGISAFLIYGRNSDLPWSASCFQTMAAGLRHRQCRRSSPALSMFPYHRSDPAGAHH